MGRRSALEATDDIERRLLADIDALGSEGRGRAAKMLDMSRDVIDRMWSSSPGRPRREMKIREARILAAFLGYELELVPASSRRRAKGDPPHQRRRAAASSE